MNADQKLYLTAWGTMGLVALLFIFGLGWLAIWITAGFFITLVLIFIVTLYFDLGEETNEN